MAIIHGVRGIGYFVHNFDKNGKYLIADGLLQDQEMMSYITKQNAEIKSLAKAIYAPDWDGVSLQTKPEEKLDFIARKLDNGIYIMAATMRMFPTQATFTLNGIKDATAEVINENRTVEIKNGQLIDLFKGFDVHLYKIIR